MNRVPIRYARLARKSGRHEAKLAYCGNVMIENRNGLVVRPSYGSCSGTARSAMRQMNATPQVEQNHNPLRGQRD